jgi:5-methylthioadenosine/S-adenosylhomocysteine deaminase
MRARFVLPLDDGLGRERRLEDGYVLAEGDRVAEVGTWSQEVAARLDALGESLQVVGRAPGGDPYPCLPGILLPGFVKAHGHDHESPIIGLAKDQPLTDWLDNAVNLFTGFLEQRRSELERRFGKSPNLVTYLKARLDDTMYGITSSMVHHCNHNKYRVDELVAANRAAGTTMLVAIGGQDRHYYPKILDTPEQALERLDRAWSRYAAEPRTRILPGPDQLFSNSEPMLRALKDWARDHGTLLHVHSSEEPRTTRWFVEQYGETPVQYAERIGILDEQTVLAHQVNTTPEDLEILRRRGVRIVHNPLANTILGSGMPPLIEMLAAGIPVAISTDGSGSADNQNIIAAARLASQYQKAYHRDATLLPAQRVLEMITVEPARILGLDAGSLAPGKQADLVLVDLRAPNLVPTRRDNCVENLIWAANGNEIRYVVAGGELILDDYKPVKLDAGEILAQVQELSELLVAYIPEAEKISGTGAHGAETTKS